jgi:glutaminyl-peptide cyclotransferase
MKTKKKSHISYLISKVFVLCSLFFALYSCNSDNQQSQQKDKDKDLKPMLVESPAFDADTAYHYIEQQVKFGPRVPNTDAHAKCANYLEKELKKYTPHVFIQKGDVKAFDGKTLKIKNIIAAFYPEKKKRILLCAHWDTRPFADQDTKDQEKPIDGANDGGSGVGVLLEVARQITLKEPGIGIDIILFDGEDYGQPEDSKFPVMYDSYCLGSQYWAKNPPTPNYRPYFGILLDMVGGKNVAFTQEEVSRTFAPVFVNKIWEIGVAAGYSENFLFKKTPPIIDDHYYINQVANIPTVDLIHYDETSKSGFWQHWHTHEDNMENIDKKSLKAVGQTLLAVIYNEPKES